MALGVERGGMTEGHDGGLGWRGTVDECDAERHHGTSLYLATRCSLLRNEYNNTVLQ